MSHEVRHGADEQQTRSGDVAVTLSTEEAEAVADVVRSYLRALPGAHQGPYADLLTAVHSARVAGAEVATLEQVCALALETGQARRIGLAEVETLVTNVFRRTPEGRSRSAAVKEVNQALTELTGKELQGARMTWTRPGRYTLTLKVDGFDLSLLIAPDGLSVQSLTAG